MHINICIYICIDTMCVCVYIYRVTHNFSAAYSTNRNKKFDRNVERKHLRKKFNKKKVRNNARLIFHLTQYPPMTMRTRLRTIDTKRTTRMLSTMDHEAFHRSTFV